MCVVHSSFVMKEVNGHASGGGITMKRSSPTSRGSERRSISREVQAESDKSVGKNKRLNVSKKDVGGKIEEVEVQRDRAVVASLKRGRPAKRPA